MEGVEEEESTEGGWNSGSTSVGGVFANLMPVIKGLGWPVYGAVLCTVFVYVLAVAGVGTVLAILHETFGVELNGWVIGASVVAMLATSVLSVGAYQGALVGTGRRRLLGEEPVGGFFASVFDAITRMPRVSVALAIVGIAQVVLVCLPGIVIVALSPVPYLVATRDEMAIIDAVWEGFAWFRRHVVTISVSAAVIYVVSSFICMGIFVVAAGILKFFGPEVLEQVAKKPHQGVGSLIALTVGQLFYFTGIATVLYTVDAAESGLSLDAPE
jgi:hypothetical protein